MWLRRYLDTPAGALFLFEARRRWGRRTPRPWPLGLLIVSGCMLLLGMLASCVLLSFLASFDPFHPPVWWPEDTSLPLNLGCSFLCGGILRSPLLVPLPYWAPPNALWLSAVEEWQLIVRVTGAPLRLVLPALAATAFAADRRTGRQGEVALLAVGPQRVFLAQGLAALAPLAPIALGGSALSLVCYLVAVAAMGGSALSEAGGMLAVGVLGVETLTAPLRLALDAALLLCISALCTRVRTAVLLCYLVGLFGTWSVEWAYGALP